jgi:ABC-type Na+ efflux pump permease subunit
MAQMTKFRAVVRREYVQRVRSRMFVVLTVGAPLMVALFTVVPMLIAGIRTGGPVRVAVLDETGRMYERLGAALQSGGDEGEGGEAAGAPAAEQLDRAHGEERHVGDGAEQIEETEHGAVPADAGAGGQRT